MGQCQFQKANGEQCKGSAAEGSDYCTVHLKKVLASEIQLPPESGEQPTPSVTEEPSKKREGKVPAIHNDLKKRRIRFTGTGTYSIPSESILFCREGQVEEVSHECWERLLSQAESKAVFEEV
jgi:hypothetical protein